MREETDDRDGSGAPMGAQAVVELKGIWLAGGQYEPSETSEQSEETLRRERYTLRRVVFEQAELAHARTARQQILGNFEDAHAESRLAADFIEQWIGFADAQWEELATPECMVDDESDGSDEDGEG